jgi:hypothetical protein
MKRFFIFACMLLVLGVLSCDKKDEDNSTDQLPEWLQAKIAEVTAESNRCDLINVEIFNFKGKTYYNISCLFWNCVYCQLFDEQGNRPAWNTTEWDDFLARKKGIKTVPACP